MSDRMTRGFERHAAHSVVVPGDRVVRSAEVAHIGGRPELPPPAPSIELVTEADIVRAIDVTCSCGQKLRIWCSYEPETSGQESVEAA